MGNSDEITIIIVVHNQLEELKTCIKAIRLSCMDIDVQILVIDNFSTDGTSQWLEGEEDIAYASMEEEGRYAAILNEALSLYGIENDILLLSADYMLTPECLKRMKLLLDEDENRGAVNPISNGFGKWCVPVNNYREAVEYEEEIKSVRQNRKRIGLYGECLLLKRKAMKRVGEFAEEFGEAYYVIEDYMIRMLHEQYILQSCENAFVYAMHEYKGCEDEAESELLNHKWGMKYFNKECNPHLVGLIDGEDNREMQVLEIGCDCGATLLEIGNRFPNAKLYGYEINQKAAEIAGYAVKVQVGNIEERNLPFEKQFFDYIILGDVLEHLRQPKKVLEYLYEFLRKDGELLISVPNLQHISVVKELLRGNFTYTRTGLLDETHIHFFTMKEIERMLEEAGYEVTLIMRREAALLDEDHELIEKLVALSPETQPSMFRAVQYVLKAEKREK